MDVSQMELSDAMLHWHTIHKDQFMRKGIEIKTMIKMSMNINTTRAMPGKTIMNTKGEGEEECEGGDKKEGGKA